jgi:DNA-binding LacI/PurR family transcriptional regulator
MAVTQRDIAKKLGVSRRLVGYALNDEAGVGDEMRQRIKDEAALMGYRPHRVALALSSGRTYQIALCFPFLGSSYFNEIIRQFEILAQATPYSLLMTTFDPSNPEQRITQFTVDGMVFVGPEFYLSHSMNHPVVVLQNQVRTPEIKGEEKFDRVSIDIESAAIEAMQHLLEQGFKRIAYVAPEAMMHQQDFRYYTYSEAMCRAGLPLETIALPIPGEQLIRQQSHQLLKEYFQTHGFPKALFCCNDDIGIGAYRALAQSGRSIPGDVAILGFDNLDDVQYLYPPMSTVRMPINEVCQQAWSMLMRRIEDPTLPPLQSNFETQLIIRESSLGHS